MFDCLNARFVPPLSLVIILVAFPHFSGPCAAAELPIAFPGAVGQGAVAVGGRGGDVYHVTTLADYANHKGEPKILGSLRYGIASAKGPRTIVFDIGGAIQLREPLEIHKSQLTIAGQTAPGGITLWGYPLNISQASDVIIRYVRVRTGDFNASPPKGTQSTAQKSTGNGAHDLTASTANAVDVGRSDRIILDHVSAAWGMDETLSVTRSRNVTVQYTIIAESLNHSFHAKGAHGYGTLIRGELTPEDQAAGTGGYTFYGCLWALHQARNPSIGGQQFLEPNQPESARRRTDVNLINNVVYGWGNQPTHRSELGDVRINCIGNYYICGPAKKSNYVFRENNSGQTSLYQDGNMFDADQDGVHNGKLVGAGDNAARVFSQFDENDKLLSPATSKPFDFFATISKAVVSADEAYRRTIAQAGASLPRDAIDQRIIDAVVHRTGKLLDSQEAYRGPEGRLAGIDDVPTAKRSKSFDSDADGMSDDFENHNGLNPHDPNDRNGIQLSKAGYTNLEVYLNSLTIGRPQ